MAGLLDRLAANPWIQAGQGMTGAPGLNTIQRMSSGIGRGVQNAQRYQQEQEAARLRQLQMKTAEQALYEQLYSNAQREAEQERASQYLMMQNPADRPRVGAMGVPKHAELAQEQIIKMNEVITVKGDKGPEQMTRYQAQQEGRMPYDIWLQSDEARRANVMLRYAGNDDERKSAEAEQKLAEDREKARMERIEAQQAAEIAYDASVGDVQGTQIAIDKLDEANKILDRPWWAGLPTAGSALQDMYPGDTPIPGTDAYDLYSTITTVQSKIGLDKLMKIKERGATMGALNKEELTLLINQLGSLDWKQDKHVLQGNIAEVKRLLNKAMENGGRVIERNRQTLRTLQGEGGGGGGFEYQGTE